jgi:aminopeptidase N
MKYKTEIISVILFLTIFFTGWSLGISPLQETIRTIKTQGKSLEQKMLNKLPVPIPSDYISKSQYNIDILHYALDIDLYPEKKILSGNCEITGVLLDKNLKEINLNFYDNMKISSCYLNGMEASFSRSDTRLTVPAVELKSDTFKLKISYEGTPKRSGLSAFVFGEINKKKVVYNLNEPNYASTWFPCNDIPTDKALVDLRITNDSIYTSVSNGVLADTSTKGARRTFHWKTFYPVSTYLVCIYSAEYKNFSQQYVSLDKADTMNIEYYVFPDHLENAKKDFEDHPEMISFFAKTFGEYPFIKEKYGVAEFLWQMGAMEHQTITGIGSNFVSGRKFYTDIYAHELAHHWWGNAVGPADWKDIWLNEGFSTYSEALYFENKSGKKALQSTMRSKFQDNFTGILAEPGDYLFSTTVYDKGAWVLHMLRWEIGDSFFFKLLRDYFEKFKYKNASTTDFKELAEKISGKNLETFFNQWVYNKGMIRIEYSWDSELINGSYFANINIKQAQEGGKKYIFPLELEIRYGDRTIKREIVNINSSLQSIRLKLDKKAESVVLDPDNWLLASISNINEDKKE